MIDFFFCLFFQIPIENKQITFTEWHRYVSLLGKQALNNQNIDVLVLMQKSGAKERCERKACL